MEWQSAMRWECLQNCGVENVAWNITVKSQIFLDGCPENIISYQYKAGQFTDDTSQALTILDSLIETDFIPNSQNIATHILEWAEKEHAFKNNILGPTSKVALKLFQEGKSAKEFSDESVSNGAAMRIAPIGTLFSTTQKEELCRYVAAVSSVTHTSDITLAGASMIAMAVASALEYHDREKMIEDALSVEEYAMNLALLLQVRLWAQEQNLVSFWHKLTQMMKLRFRKYLQCHRSRCKYFGICSRCFSNCLLQL